MRQAVAGRIRSGREADASGSFWNNATELLNAAEGVRNAGGEVTGVDVLIGYDGQVHLFMNGGIGPLDALRAHHGARMAFRVSQQDHCVRVEGRAGSRTCLFEAAKPDGAARFLLANRAAYCVSPLHQRSPDRQTRKAIPAASPASAWYS
ncbi:MAG: hypothetical protein R2762_05195 [Bryobacteraceae bacterium]